MRQRSFSRLALVLAICTTTPLPAQPTQAQFDSLRADVAAMQAVLAGRAPLTRMHELGVAMDGVVDRIKDIPVGTTVKNYIDQRLVWVPRVDTLKIVSTFPTTIPALTINGGLTVNGDVIANNGRVCVFYAANGPARLGTIPRVCQGGAQFQAVGEGSSISFVSNPAGLDGQSPRTHGADIQLGPDGGLRPRNNPADHNPYYDNQRPSGYFGLDSQSNFVLLQRPMCGAVPCADIRELFFHWEPGTKVIEIATGSLAWTFRFTTSTGDRTFDRHWTVPQQ